MEHLNSYNIKHTSTYINKKGDIVQYHTSLEESKDQFFVHELKEEYTNIILPKRDIVLQYFSKMFMASKVDLEASKSISRLRANLAVIKKDLAKYTSEESLFKAFNIQLVNRIEKAITTEKHSFNLLEYVANFQKQYKVLDSDNRLYRATIQFLDDESEMDVIMSEYDDFSTIEVDGIEYDDEDIYYHGLSYIDALISIYDGTEHMDFRILDVRKF